MTEAATVRVEHAGLGLALAVPREWEVTEQPNGLVAIGVAPSDGVTPPPGFAATMEPLPRDWDGHGIAEQALLGEAHWLTDLRLIDEDEVQLAGLPATRTLATYRQGLWSLTLEQWHVVLDDNVVVLAGTGPTARYAALRDVWHAIAASLERRDR